MGRGLRPGELAHEVRYAGRINVVEPIDSDTTKFDTDNKSTTVAQKD